MKALTSSIALCICLLSTTTNAALVSRLGGQAVYDTDLNITWLADASLVATNSFGLMRNANLGGATTGYGVSQIYGTTGGMTWDGALKWIAAMNTANYLGFNNWRLPTTLQPDASCDSQNATVASFGFHCTGSEMGHLFYNELGGVAGQAIATTHNANYNLFQNLWSANHWSETVFAPSGYPYADYYARFFTFQFGNQNVSVKNDASYVLAVRPGDVATIPVPATAWLLGSGLLGLIGVARRKAA